MKELGTKLAIAERSIPAVPTPLGDSSSLSKVDNQNALLGFLASSDSQVQSFIFHEVHF